MLARARRLPAGRAWLSGHQAGCYRSGSWSLSHEFRPVNTRRCLYLDQRIIHLYDQFTHGGIDPPRFSSTGWRGLRASAAAGRTLLPLLQ